jgi:hypothetical protein
LRTLITTLGGLLLAGAAIPVFADTVTFNFNSIAENASAITISSTLTSQLQAAGCTGCTVSVSGSVYADKTWNADGHVTGPGTGATSFTLATASSSLSGGSTTSNSVFSSQSSYNTFLATTSDSGTTCGSGDCEISLVFSGLTLTSLTGFNYEIFPDLSCTALNSSSCGGSPTGGIYPDQPDLTLSTGSGLGTVVSGFGSGGTLYGVTPGTTNGNAVHSPNSGLFSTETAPQLIGTWNTSLSLGGATELNFIDWPATIGFDNVQLTFNSPDSPVPEPGSFLLLGTAAAGALLIKRRIARKAS